MEEYGLALAFTGAALATFLSGIGSSIGLGIGGRSATGILSEKPEQYGLMTLLVVLPSTQGIYGFLVAFLILMFTGILAGEPIDLTLADGFKIFFAGVITSDKI